MLRDDISDKAFDSFLVPIGTVEISPAIHRRVVAFFCRVLWGRLNLPLAVIQASLQDADSFAAFPGSELPG